MSGSPLQLPKLSLGVKLKRTSSLLARAMRKTRITCLLKSLRSNPVAAPKGPRREELLERGPADRHDQPKMGNGL